ncbi:DNA-binding helix-turn-helix protein [Streptococcus australis ATCC 700641]|uniref:DNA-binding helix-turn-helix protein n=1 Tax=Streptococcus australis ATCC 700641 TaxID=888833 RepID=E7S9F1_9STRE|nr:DNA-binding helix-turn-helix protein [Streptococcus australis ATCC 700641]
MPSKLNLLILYLTIRLFNCKYKTKYIYNIAYIFLPAIYTIVKKSKRGFLVSVKKLSIGSQIKSYRIKLKLTQQELAERSELSLPFMNLVENDKRNLSVETLLKILDGLEISPSEFFLPFSEDISPDLSELVGKLQTNQNSDKYINIFNNILDIPNSN